MCLCVYVMSLTSGRISQTPAPLSCFPLDFRVHTERDRERERKTDDVQTYKHTSTIECVLLLQNVCSYYRMCFLTTVLNQQSKVQTLCDLQNRKVCAVSGTAPYNFLKKQSCTLNVLPNIQAFSFSLKSQCPGIFATENERTTTKFQP